MLAPKFFIYWIGGPGKTGKIEISPNPRVDAWIFKEEGYREIRIIQPPQPIWVAEMIRDQLQRLSSPDDFRKRGTRLLKEIFPHIPITIDSYALTDIRLADYEPPLVEVEQLLRGRVLLGSEIPALLKSHGLEPPWDPENWLQYLYLNRIVNREAAVSTDFLGIPFCRRCGTGDGLVATDCMVCGDSHCYLCTNCQSMGISRSCIPLYTCPGSEEEVNHPIEFLQPELDFELTPPQQDASRQLLSFWETGKAEFLVWAVCGGGKTEVSFGIISRVLSEGGRVLVAIPRKDVVSELQPRFQKAFPGIDTIALFGGSGQKFSEAPLIVATTHQCLRMYHRFDLVILDEADAFPYQGSIMLDFAVRRALKPGGRLVIMTATPDPVLLRKATNGRIPYVSIPARYHRQPLIVPEFVKGVLSLNGRNETWEPPPPIRQFLRKLRETHRKALIFLPTIRQIEEFGGLLVQWAACEGIPGNIVYSRTTDREERKNALITGELRFLVTSTIFERGITIADLDAMIVNADYETIFDCRTLVQIAGRVSRKGDPATVIFMAKTESGAMKESCRWIRRMNQEGFDRGYLDREE